MGETPVAEGGVHVAGGAMFGIPGDHAMVRAEDGLYEYSVTLPYSSEYDYTFANGPCEDWSW